MGEFAFERNLESIFFVDLKLNLGVALGAHDLSAVLRRLDQLETLDFVLRLELTSQKHQVVTAKQHLSQFFSLLGSKDISSRSLSKLLPECS